MKNSDILFLLTIYILTLVSFCLLFSIIHFFQIFLSLNFVIPVWFLICWLLFTFISSILFLVLLKVRGKELLNFYNTKLCVIQDSCVEKLNKYGVFTRVNDFLDNIYSKYFL